MTIHDNTEEEARNNPDSFRKLLELKGAAKKALEKKPEPTDFEHANLKKMYAGEWANDLKHGSGNFFYDDGSIYQGKWENDMKNGWGRMTYADGAVYEGEWFEEKRHGHGILLLGISLNS